jgi:hypothetical protein
MVPWTWVARAVREAQKHQFVAGPPIGALTQQIVQARNAIQTIHTYFDTQLPYAYVHLITLMVSLSNLATAMKCGVVMANAWEDTVKAARRIDEGADPSSPENINATKIDRMRMFSECLFVIVVPFVYDGLLAISYMIHDPFGEDMLDFPITAYTASVVDNCYATQYAADNFPGCFGPLPVKAAPSPGPGVLDAPTSLPKEPERAVNVVAPTKRQTAASRDASPMSPSWPAHGHEGRGADRRMRSVEGERSPKKR